MERLLKLENEQWVILIVMAILLICHIDWGLPDAERTQMLTYGTPLSVQQRERLTTSREAAIQDRERSIQAEARALLAGKKIDFNNSLSSGAVFSENERIHAFRSFIMRSRAVDENAVYWSLSRMRPSKFEFDPKQYYYGGSFLYPLGATIYILRSLGLLHITSDLSHYLEEPAQIAHMYWVGRLFNIGAYLGTLILLASIGRLMKNSRSGTFAMLAYSCSGLVIYHSLVTKPHVYAAFWFLLSILLLCLYRMRKRALLLASSAFCLGWAAGSSCVIFAGAAAYPIMLYEPGGFSAAIKKTLFCWVIVLLVYTATNPYVVINHDKFYYTIMKMGTPDGDFAYMQFGLAKFFRSFKNIILAYGFPFSLFGLIGIIWGITRGDPLEKRIAALSAFLLLPLSNLLPRVSLFLGPLLCLFSGFMLDSFFSRLNSNRRVLKIIITSMLLAPGIYSLFILKQAKFMDSKDYGTIRAWTSQAELDHETTMGVFQAPSPLTLPPFPFLNSTMINLSAHEDPRLMPTFVIVGEGWDQPRRWDAHPFRPNYQLAHPFVNARYLFAGTLLRPIFGENSSARSAAGIYRNNNL